MQTNIILAGVGGQGILSIAFVLDSAALDVGYQFKQAEVHGMAQRGGAVQSHLRLADAPIASDLIPSGQVDLVVAMEPLEALRYAHHLRPGGVVVANRNPFVNIDDYPPLDEVLGRIASLPGHVLVDADGIAKEAGSARAVNMATLGAASPLLPFEPSLLEEKIRLRFAGKRQRIIDLNVDAFRTGRAASARYTD